jgi:Protein of unknown function (DUF3626)
LADLADHVTVLTDGQVAALAHVRAVGVRTHDRAAARLGDVADVDAICGLIRDHGRITLNFHPDRLLADGSTVAAALARDGIYRSQFETQISNGSRTAFAGGDRDQWEHTLFGAAYHHVAVVAADRPKYGALNLLNHPDGGAPRFGSSHVRLRPNVNDRATFTFGDSHLGPADIGTIDAFTPVLAALLETARDSGTALGVPVDDLARRLRELAALPVGADPAMPPSRSLDHYVEAQVHGLIDLAVDAEAIVVDPSFHGTLTGDLLHETAAHAGIALEWHCGFEIAAADVPADFREPETPAFAREVCDRLEVAGRYDAAVVGRAAASVIRDPDSWAGWGTQEDLRQQVKYLWHVLVAFGIRHSG